jgi:general secretion pathway protein G
MILKLASKRNELHRRSAFTLLEVLVVVAILVVLASIASIYVFRYLEDNKKDQAKFDIMALDKAAKTYMIRNNNNPPDNLQEVLQFIENGDQTKLMDPWGKAYQYDPGHGTGIIVISTVAPDGQLINNSKAKQVAR